MKTTVDVLKALLDLARKVAAREGTTPRALVERGLRAELAASRATGRFKLRDASVGGLGVRPGAERLSWSELRAIIYEGRGG